MGLRAGEVLALSNYDIDLKNRKVNIHRTLTTDEKGNTIMGNKTKTYAGKRIVPLPDFLYPYIVEQMRNAENQERNEEKLLFKPNTLKYARRKTVNDELKRILNTYTSVFDKFKENEIDKVNRYYLNENLISRNCEQELDER